MNTNIRCKQMFGKQYRKQRSWDLFVYVAKDIAKDLKICFKTNKSKNDINYNGEIISIIIYQVVLKLYLKFYLILKKIKNWDLYFQKLILEF